MVIPAVTITWWQVFCVVFAAGGLFTKIVMVTSTQKKQGVAIGDCVTKIECEKSTDTCQKATGRTLDTMKDDIKELKDDMKKTSVFMGRVEEHMRVQNNRERQLDQGGMKSG